MEKKQFKYAVGEEVQIFDEQDMTFVYGTITEIGDDTFFVKWDDLHDDTEYEKTSTERISHKEPYALNQKVITQYYENEIFEVVGIRSHELELLGDWSGGTHNVQQRSWYPRGKCKKVN